MNAHLARRLPALLLLFPAVPALAQKPVCNDRDRYVSIEAGYHNHADEEQCFQWSIELPFTTIKPPASCAVGYSHFPKNFYSCDTSGEVDGSHCEGNTYERKYYSYSEGGCPEFPDLEGFDVTEWDSWKKVPKKLRKLFKCIPPKREEVSDDYAVVVDCNNGTKKDAEFVEGETYAGASGPTFSVIRVAPSELAEGLNYFETVFERAEDLDPTSLPGTLGGIALFHPPVAAEFHASVVARHFDPLTGEEVHKNAETFVGRMCTDGCYDIERSYVILSEQGEPSTARHRTTYDGWNLRDLDSSESVGDHYVPACSVWEYGLQSYSLLTEPLWWWCSDPFDLSAYQGLHAVEQDGGPDDHVAVRIMYPGDDGPICGEQYLVELTSSGPRPYRRELLTAGGAVEERYEYKAFRAIAPDVWRPFQVIRTVFDDEGQAVFQCELSVTRGRILTESEADSVPEEFSESTLWMSWN